MLDPNLAVGGWNTVFVGTFIASAIYAFVLYRTSHHESKRLLLGFGLVVLGAALRIGGWFPWRAFLYAGDYEMAAWWKSFSTIWTSGGALVMIVGMTVLMWPALRRWWGDLAIFVVPLAEAMLFFVGVLLTLLLSKPFD